MSVYLPESGNERINEAYERCVSLGIDVRIPQEPDDIAHALEMLRDGEVEGVVCGIDTSSADVLRNSIKIIGSEEKFVSSYFIMQKDDERLLFADCAVVPNPTSEQLALIAIQTANSARSIGIEPKVAMMSFSTDGSASTPEVEKIQEAVRILDSLGVDFDYDGEWQFDSAYNIDIRSKKVAEPKFTEKANVYIFPDLNSGNVAYKVAQQLAGYVAVGPLLQGLRKPVNDLSRGSTVEDIVQVILVTDKMINNK